MQYLVSAFSLAALLFCATACTEDTASGPADSSTSDADTGSGLTCAEASSAFQSFVYDNRECTEDSECAIVGDCSPNADFTAVRADVAEEAYGLMVQRCATLHDGPEYVAVCESGQCTAVRDGYVCGGLGGPARPYDSGVDASDAGDAGDAGDATP